MLTDILADTYILILSFSFVLTWASTVEKLLSCSLNEAKTVSLPISISPFESFKLSMLELAGTFGMTTSYMSGNYGNGFGLYATIMFESPSLDQVDVSIECSLPNFYQLTAIIPTSIGYSVISFMLIPPLASLPTDVGC